MSQTHHHHTNGHHGHSPHVRALAEAFDLPEKVGVDLDAAERAVGVQERLTTQTSRWFERELALTGVGVVLEVEHTCMWLRGVAKPGTPTVTSTLHGLVRDDSRTRQECFALTGRIAHG